MNNLEQFIGSILAEIVINPFNGEIIALENQKVTLEILKKCRLAEIEYIVIK